MLYAYYSLSDSKFMTSVLTLALILHTICIFGLATDIVIDGAKL